MVVFPSDSPTSATGPGAIAWGASASCPGGPGPRIALLGAGDVPEQARAPRAPDGRELRLRGRLLAGAAPEGRIVLAGEALPGAGQELLEGPAAGPFSIASAAPAPPGASALSTGYLGDVAFASAAAGGGPELSLERHYQLRFSPPVPLQRHGGSPDRLTVALDYRSDALLVWQQAGWLYACELPAGGAPDPAVRLASVDGQVTISALLSDDSRATAAWSEEVGGVTSIYLDRSGPDVRFGAPELLERSSNPYGQPAPPASPRLVRLSSESVMLAWAGASDGRWLVRTAAIDLHGLGSIATISPSGADALLAGLAPGPDGSALALWTEPQLSAGGAPEPAHQAIFAARGIDAYPALTRFESPEQVAPPGPNSEAGVTQDPSTGDAVAVWRGAGGAPTYAVRSGH
jgi:hypothetical protein